MKRIATFPLLIASFAFSLPTWADMQTTAVEGVAYSINKSMADNLQGLTGKKVTVTLSSGHSVTGMVKEANASLLHLEKLDGKEFFDALIKVDEISAIETRFRMPAR